MTFSHNFKVKNEIHWDRASGPDFGLPVWQERNATWNSVRPVHTYTRIERAFPYRAHDPPPTGGMMGIRAESVRRGCVQEDTHETSNTGM